MKLQTISHRITAETVKPEVSMNGSSEHVITCEASVERAPLVVGSSDDVGVTTTREPNPQTRHLEVSADPPTGDGSQGSPTTLPVSSKELLVGGLASLQVGASGKKKKVWRMVARRKDVDEDDAGGIHQEEDADVVIDITKITQGLIESGEETNGAEEKYGIDSSPVQQSPPVSIQERISFFEKHPIFPNMIGTEEKFKSLVKTEMKHPTDSFMDAAHDAAMAELKSKGEETVLLEQKQAEEERARLAVRQENKEKALDLEALIKARKLQLENDLLETATKAKAVELQLKIKQMEAAMELMNAPPEIPMPVRTAFGPGDNFESCQIPVRRVWPTQTLPLLCLKLALLSIHLSLHSFWWALLFAILESVFIFWALIYPFTRYETINACVCMCIDTQTFDNMEDVRNCYSQNIPVLSHSNNPIGLPMSRWKITILTRETDWNEESYDKVNHYHAIFTPNRWDLYKAWYNWAFLPDLRRSETELFVSDDMVSEMLSMYTTHIQLRDYAGTHLGRGRFVNMPMSCAEDIIGDSVNLGELKKRSSQEKAARFRRKTGLNQLLNY